MSVSATSHSARNSPDPKRDNALNRPRDIASNPPRDIRSQFHRLAASAKATPAPQGGQEALRLAGQEAKDRIAGQIQENSDAQSDPDAAAAADRFQSRAQNLSTEQPEVFSEILTQAYGDKQGNGTLAGAAANGDLPMPAEVRFVDPDVLNGGEGAYSAENGGTVYLSEDLRNDPARLDAVFAQEVGHHFDAVLGGPDSVGDEGRAFAMGLEKGRALTPDELARAQSITDKGTITVDGKEVEVEFALPAILVWLGEGAAQTVGDAALGEIMEQLTGAEYGFWDGVLDFGLNLIPGAGEASTAKKLKKLTEAVDTIIDGVKLADKLPKGLKGKVEPLQKEIKEHFDAFVDAVKSGNAGKAGEKWGETIGKLRELQVAGRIADNGGELLDINKKIKIKGGDREFDVFFKEGNKKVVGEVKTGKRMTDSAGAKNFDKTVQNFVKARDAAKKELDADYRVYVDDISDDMLKALKDEGIEVVRNKDFLK
ncbi:hypothetical protein [Paracoccus sp. (in: a-proteobacteria)]|uniref:hypothetical protein n=1 Tax=Paracoccus sp. TaxID=267 RepID=UPI003A83AEFB